MNYKKELETIKDEVICDLQTIQKDFTEYAKVLGIPEQTELRINIEPKEITIRVGKSLLWVSEHVAVNEEEDEEDA